MKIASNVQSVATEESAMLSESPGVTAPGPVVLELSVTGTTQQTQLVSSIDFIEPVETDYEADPPVKRKRGRPSKAETSARLNGVTPAQPKIAQQQLMLPIAASVDYESLGKMAANLWFNSGELILGVDWQPLEGEPNVVKNAFRDYFKEAGVSNISPAWGLGIVLFTYSAARVSKPTVKSRVLGGWLWFKSKVKR